MTNSLRLFIIKIFNRYINKYVRESFSQEGEDLLLRRIFENKKYGFYIDIGAHHPQRFSNTYIFYQKGWRGINIEPNPEMHELFLKIRRKDINIRTGVSEKPDQLKYYMFHEAALNTFDGRLAHEYQNNAYKIKEEIIVGVCRLDDLLSSVMAPGINIDFMSIDAEGYDLSVLKSNNWELFRPKILLIEILGCTLANVHMTEEHIFIESQDYELVSKTVNTFFYRDIRN